MSKSLRPQKADLSRHVTFSLLLGGVLLLAFYNLFRYQGLLGETDTHVFTFVTRAMLDSGRLVSTGNVYPNGYGYQALLLFLVHLTGLSISTWQLIGSVFLMLWIVFPAWLLYREFTGTTQGALWATVFLFIQPEFLFSILRGTHEKFTRGLMLLCFYLLLRSLRSEDRVGRFAGLVLAFYLTGYALITFNNLLATSFIAAVAIALLLSAAAASRFSFASIVPMLKRLRHITLILVTLALLFTFYAYEPAQHQILVLHSIWDRLAALFLDLEHLSSNPYLAVNRGWINLPVYFSVSLANWLLLVTSAIIWLWQSRRIWQHEPPKKPSELLLWAFYGGFALMGVLSIAVDISGALASNLQHRVFPSFVMLAAPLVAKWLTEWNPKAKSRSHFVYRNLYIGIALLAVLSTLKATNEPLLSNKWLFYLPAEITALDWAQEHLAEQTLWSGYDERLLASYEIHNEGERTSTPLIYDTVEAGTQHFLISDVTRSRSLRLSQPLPVDADTLLTFDNGQVQLFQLRPRTPYQK